MDDSSNFLFVRGFIQRVSLPRGKFGPAPRFSPEDPARALLLAEKRVGRSRLARQLGVGEGTARTVLSSLSRKGLVDSAPMGVKLTGKGQEFVSGMRRRMPKVCEARPSRLTFGEHGSAAQLRGVRLPASALSLRDEMVRSGASGATILRFESGRLIIPPFHAPTHREYASELALLSRQFSFAEGDAVLLVFGRERVARERALFHACSLLGI